MRSLTRREFLVYAWLTSLAAATAASLRVGWGFARSRARQGELGGVFNMGLVSELPPPGSPPVNEPAGRFWLVHTQAGVLGLAKTCTHLDCLCNWDDQSLQFVCPCHASRFAEDGTYLEGPAGRDLDRFVVQIVAPTGEVVAETDLQTGLPLPVGAEGTAQANVLPAGGPGNLLFVDTGRRIRGGPAA
jgi:cytochrome b6-f complex iron-sulfur subunit